MDQPPDYYDLLRLPHDASPEEIRRSYREAALRLHPDVNQAPGETELFIASQQAFEVLSDPAKRTRYDESLAQETDPVSVGVLYSSPAIPPIDEPQLVYALIELAVQEDHASARQKQPLNVCLVLDRSTSMRGERMDGVKSSAIELVRQTGPNDLLSIVVFGDRAEVILPAGAKLSRQEVERRIHMIRTGGGTEMLPGLQAALGEVSRGLGHSRVNHIILLTDGRTYGDEAACLEIARQALTRGIGITALGIGGNWNDAFLDRLATMSGGRSLYIHDPRQVRDCLSETFQHLGAVYAEQVTFEGYLGQGVELTYAFRLNPQATPLPLQLPLRFGGLQSQGNLSVLMEFSVSPAPAGAGRVSLAFGKLVLSLPGQAAIRLPLHLSRPCRDTGRLEPPSRVLQAIRQVSLYRMQDQAREDVARGEIDAASWRLSRLANHLAALGHTDLATAVLGEASHLQQSQSFTEEGDKRIKYATRALYLPPGE